jgi:hypothetical protein
MVPGYLSLSSGCQNNCLRYWDPQAEYLKSSTKPAYYSIPRLSRSSRSLLASEGLGSISMHGDTTGLVKHGLRKLETTSPPDLIHRYILLCKRAQIVPKLPQFPQTMGGEARGWRIWGGGW